MLGIPRHPYFSADTHWINLTLLNRPGVLGEVLGVVGHHGGNLENVRVDRLDSSDRSSGVLKVTIPEARLAHVEGDLNRLIGVFWVEVIPSRSEAWEDVVADAGGQAAAPSELSLRG